MRLARLRHRLGTMRLERRRVNFYRQFVGPGQLAFDVGAHVGDRTALLVRAGARVVAVEPQRELQEKLERAFGAEPQVTVVAEAVGAKPGAAVLRRPPGGGALASMSTEWITRVRTSGRFGAAWAESEPVRVTTLDALIARHGLPAFCKIDVEGYEYEVLCGLSNPIRVVSLEFTPEYLDSTDRSLRRLEELGDYRFNYALGETLRLVELEWLPRQTLLERLRGVDPRMFGDVYARLAG